VLLALVELAVAVMVPLLLELQRLLTALLIQEAAAVVEISLMVMVAMAALE